MKYRGRTISESSDVKFKVIRTECHRATKRFPSFLRENV